MLRLERLSLSLILICLIGPGVLAQRSSTTTIGSIIEILSKSVTTDTSVGMWRESTSQFSDIPGAMNHTSQNEETGYSQLPSHIEASYYPPSVSTTTSPGASSSSSDISSGITSASFASNDWQRCQSAWLSFEDLVKSLGGSTVSHYRTTIPGSIFIWTYSTIISLGTASPYTTIEGYPYVKGTFTVTDISESTWFETSSVDAIACREGTTLVTAPSCIIPGHGCSSLWRNFFQRNGLPTSDLYMSFPEHYQTASDRPRCLVSTSTCYTQSLPDETIASMLGIPNFSGNNLGLCHVDASVSLFYWPPKTTLALNQSIQPQSIVTTKIGEIVLTSPTVYLSLPGATATAGTIFSVSCDIRSLNGQVSVSKDFGMVTTLITLGSSLANVKTHDLYSWVYDHSVLPSASLIDYLAKSGIPITSGGGAIIRVPYGTLTSRQVGLAALTRPPSVEAYYLNAFPSYLGSGPNCTSCGYIFESQYEPVLKIPTALVKLFPQQYHTWSWFGFLRDPPSALRQESSADPVTSSNTAIVTTATPLPGLSLLPSPSPGNLPPSPAAPTTTNPQPSPQTTAPPSQVQPSPASRTSRSPSTQNKPSPDVRTTSRTPSGQNPMSEIEIIIGQSSIKIANSTLPYTLLQPTPGSPKSPVVILNGTTLSIGGVPATIAGIKVSLAAPTGSAATGTAAVGSMGGVLVIGDHTLPLTSALSTPPAAGPSADLKTEGQLIPAGLGETTFTFTPTAGISATAPETRIEDGELEGLAETRQGSSRSLNGVVGTGMTVVVADWKTTGTREGFDTRSSRGGGGSTTAGGGSGGTEDKPNGTVVPSSGGSGRLGKVGVGVDGVVYLGVMLLSFLV